MPFINCPVITFDLFALYPSSTTNGCTSDTRRASEPGEYVGKEEYVGRFSLTKKEEEALLDKYGFSRHHSLWQDNYYDYGYSIIVKMFEQFYSFDKGLNGFQCRWLPNKVFEDGYIYWNMDYWRIKRVR